MGKRWFRSCTMYFSGCLDKGLEVVPLEAREGVLAVEVLLLRALLQALDALEAPAPHLDVEDDEEDEQHDDKPCGGEAVAAAEVGADHEQGVVGAVQQHGVEQGVEEVLAAACGVEFGQREVVAHRDGEEEVGRHGQHAAHEGGGHLVAALHHVADVFHTGEAEREVGGVDDAVEVLVEVGAAPDDEHEQQQFAELLAEAGHAEAVEEAVEDGERRGVWRQGHEHALHQAGGDDAEAADKEGEQQLADGFGLVFVLAVDEEEQQRYRQDGGDEGDVHGA